MAVIYPFMQGLREAAFPAPGKTVTLKSFIPDSGTEVRYCVHEPLPGWRGQAWWGAGTALSVLPSTGLAQTD